MTRRLRAFHFGEVPAPPVPEPQQFMGQPWSINLPDGELKADGEQYFFTDPNPQPIIAANAVVVTQWGRLLASTVRIHAGLQRTDALVHVGPLSLTAPRVQATIVFGNLVAPSRIMQPLIARCRSDIPHNGVELAVQTTVGNFNIPHASCTALWSPVEAADMMVVQEILFQANAVDRQ